MIVLFKFTPNFDECRRKIEQHLYNSVLSIEKNEDLAIRSIERFSHSIDKLLLTLREMYQNQFPEKLANEGSFPISDGRYRVFYKIIIEDSNSCELIFFDIDDNKQSNLDRFPAHKLISFEHED